MSKLDPQKARALAKRLWQAHSVGDVAALESLYAEDVVWHSSGRGAHAGHHRGRENVLGFLAGIGEDVARLNASLEDILVGEAYVANLMRVSGRRGDRSLDMTYVVLIRIERERIAEVWSFPQDLHAVDAFWA